MNASLIVSIIIPTYNRQELITDTLESILSQTYKNWECLVIDDGSEDNSVNVIKTFVQKDKRIKLYQRNSQSKGAPVCRNIGIQKASGDYIMFLDSDDLLAPYCLEDRVNQIKNYPQIDFLVFQSQLFNTVYDDLKLINNLLYKSESDDLTRFIAYDYPWQTSSAILKKDTCINKIGKWDERLACHQDLDFYIRSIVNNCGYLKIDSHPHVYLRMGNVDKQSSRRLSRERVNSKIFFIENIIAYLRKAELLDKYKRSIIDLTIFEFAIFVKGKKPISYLRLVKTLVRNRILTIFSAIRLFFDIGYHYLSLLNKRFPLLFQIYHSLYKITKPGIRLKNTPPKNSTLAKIKLSEYEKSVLRNNFIKS